MNYNDKFLDVCFKIGKIIFSILLLIALVVTIVLWSKTVISYIEGNKVEIKYEYSAKDIVNNLYAEELGIKQNVTSNSKVDKKDSKEEKKASEIFSKFIDDNNLPVVYKNNVKMPIDDKEKVAFIKNFVVFYSDFRSEFKQILKDKKINDDKIDILLEQNKENLYNDAMNTYINAYSEEVQKYNEEKQQLDIKKQSSLTFSLISLATFILFLFLPILIRIEENTRKLNK